MNLRGCGKTLSPLPCTRGVVLLLPMGWMGAGGVSHGLISAFAGIPH